MRRDEFVSDKLRLTDRLDFREPRGRKRADNEAKSTRNRKVGLAFKCQGGGISQAGRMYVLVKSKNAKRKAIPVDQGREELLAALRSLGVPIVSRQAQEAALQEIQRGADLIKDRRIRVADNVGIHKASDEPAIAVFAFPDRIYGDRGGKGWHLSMLPRLEKFSAKYRQRGTLKAWARIPKLARGNSRFITTLCLAFCGALPLLVDVEPVGLQLFGPEGVGKSGIGYGSGSAWGKGQDDDRSRRLGFAETWGDTIRDKERLVLGHNNIFLILDETGLSTQTKAQFLELLEILIRFDSSAERGRLTDTIAARGWFVPILSTSNRSLNELGVLWGVQIEGWHRERLIDVPAGVDKPLFEDLHGFSPADFTAEIKRIAAENCGVAGRTFIRRLMRAIAASHAALKAKVEHWRASYIQAAERRGLGSGRVTQRFATVYAGGRLAMEMRILSFDRKEVRSAILTCHADAVTAAQNVERKTFDVGAIMEKVKAAAFHFPTVDECAAMGSAEVLAKMGFKVGAEIWVRRQHFDTLVPGITRQQLDELASRNLLKTSGKKNRKFVVKRPVGRDKSALQTLMVFKP